MAEGFTKVVLAAPGGSIVAAESLRVRRGHAAVPTPVPTPDVA